MQYSRKSITIQMPSHQVLAAMLFQWPRFCHDETKGDYCSKAISIANSDTGQHTSSVFPPLLCSAPRWDGICVSLVVFRTSCQAVLPRDVALPKVPCTRGCQPGLPGMCDPHSSCCHRPRDTTPQPTGALGFSHQPSRGAEPASLKCALERNPLPS